jgi:hypothetical protein
MQFGLVLNWHMPTGASAGLEIPNFDTVVEQIRLAEGLGFTSVWPMRHDQVRGGVPATWPQELMTKIAAATQTIRIGHRLGPTHRHDKGPLDAAEQVAALDLLCCGRLEIDCSASAARAVDAVDPDRESTLGTRAGDQIAVNTMVICSATGGTDFSPFQAVRWPCRRRPATEDLIAAAPARTTPHTAFDRPAPSSDPIRGGDATRCVEAVRAYEKVGVNRLLCHFPVRGGAYACITDAMTRFAHGVIPALA